MQNIVGTRIHDEILGLIDRSQGGVILVSPFIRMWPELRRAVARAVARGVNVSLITRGPNGGPRDEDLAAFFELEVRVHEVPDLHLKAYLSEKEAIHTSVNLTRQSLDRSLESSLLFVRTEDAEGWNNVFEVWAKTLDDAARAEESGPMEFENFLVPIRMRADEGDSTAREAHRYCIVCGATASAEADEVVCLRCRAGAIAEDRDPHAVAGTRCARCNGSYRRSTVERPFCDPCYRAEQERYQRRPATWYVNGATAAIDVWSALDDGRAAPELSRAAQDALARRWAVLLPQGGWLASAVTAITPKPVRLWSCAMPPTGVDIAKLSGVTLERVPVKSLPTCRDLPTFTPERGLHVAYRRSEVPRDPVFWVVEQTLAAWDLALPRGPDPKVTNPDWVWRMLLSPRRAFAPGVSLEPGRVHLQIDLDLTVPSDLRPKWREAATFLQQVMLASLHSYDAPEVREWLTRGEGKAVEGIATALAGPAPLGPASLVRGAKGEIRDLPSRSDRATVIRVAVSNGDAWRLKGSVSKVKKAPIH